MYVKTPRELGALIRDARRDANLTQAELASRLGFSQGWVSEIEQGKERADIGRVMRTLSILGMRVDVSFDQTACVAGVEAAGRIGAVQVDVSQPPPYTLDEIV